jgi:hypothetical protein
MEWSWSLRSPRAASMRAKSRYARPSSGRAPLLVATSIATLKWASAVSHRRLRAAATPRTRGIRNIHPLENSTPRSATCDSARYGRSAIVGAAVRSQSSTRAQRGASAYVSLPTAFIRSAASASIASHTPCEYPRRS